jgi:hypothetical protein
MSNLVQETGAYTNISGSALIHTGRGHLLGIFVAQASASPTIKVWDAVSAAVPILINEFIPSAAVFYPMPANYGTGIYVTIGGTVDCTVFHRPALS